MVWTHWGLTWIQFCGLEALGAKVDTVLWSGESGGQRGYNGLETLGAKMDTVVWSGDSGGEDGYSFVILRPWELKWIQFCGLEALGAKVDTVLWSGDSGG